MEYKNLSALFEDKNFNRVSEFIDSLTEHTEEDSKWNEPFDGPASFLYGLVRGPVILVSNLITAPLDALVYLVRGTLGYPVYSYKTFIENEKNGLFLPTDEPFYSHAKALYSNDDSVFQASLNVVTNAIIGNTISFTSRGLLYNGVYGSAKFTAVGLTRSVASIDAVFAKGVELVFERESHDTSSDDDKPLLRNQMKGLGSKRVKDNSASHMSPEKHRRKVTFNLSSPPASDESSEEEEGNKFKLQ